MDESVCEQEREKQTLLKVRTNISSYNLVFMSAHISRTYSALVASFHVII